MRHSARRILIRSLLSIRLSRVSILALGALSAAATVFILAGGSAHSTAQLAALAALHQRPVTVAQVAPATAAPAPVPAGGSDAVPAPSLNAGTAPPPSESGPAPTTDTGSGSGSAPDSTDADSGSDTPTTGTPATTTTTTTTTTASPVSSLPTVRHVFEIVLSTTSYAAAFGQTSTAPYLRALESKGTLLSGYASLGEGELADELAMVSGQAPNAATRAGCTAYTDFPQGVVANANGTVPGSGCVYPETALTLGDQVSASGHAWRAYIAGMGSASCMHPNSGAVNDRATGTATGYDTLHNPFIYFHSLLDLGDCAADDLDISHLGRALSTSSRTPAYAFIAPGVCADAASVAGLPPTGGPSPTRTTNTTTTSATAAATTTTDTTSAATTDTPSTTGSSSVPTATTSGCPPAQPVGIAAENAFVKQWVPRILASAAYRAGGVLIIALAEGGAKTAGHAMRTGALVISRYARARRTVSTSYGPYSLLASVEDMLGYESLAHAKTAPSFAAVVLSHKLS